MVGCSAVSFNVQIAEDWQEPVELGRGNSGGRPMAGCGAHGTLSDLCGQRGAHLGHPGSGTRSPYVLNEATTSGVVSGVFPGLGGFWIQEVETDDDPATSAGLFVLYGDEVPAEPPVKAGDLVQVNGRVREISGQTTLHVADEAGITLLDEGQPLPEAVLFDPPQENEAADIYKEALEGMLVTLPGTAVAVAPTTQYGEYVLLNDHWGVSSVRRGEPSGFFIMVDDGSQVAHADQSTLPYVVAKGDLVQDLSGPLAYTFDQFKIEPLAVPVVTSAEREVACAAARGRQPVQRGYVQCGEFLRHPDPHPDRSAPPHQARSMKTN